MIRDAVTADASRIAALLEELGYATTAEEVARRLAGLTGADAVLITDDGLIALHRVPRIAEGGAFARITALVVASRSRGDGVCDGAARSCGGHRSASTRVEKPLVYAGFSTYDDRSRSAASPSRR